MRQADLEALRNLLSAGHSPNTLDAAGLPPVAYLMDHVDYIGFVLSDQIVTMISLLRAAGAYPPPVIAKRRVMDEVWRSVTSAGEANEARMLDDLLNFQAGDGTRPIPASDHGSDKPSTVLGDQDGSRSAVSGRISKSREARVILVPMDRGRRVFIGTFLLLLAVAFVVLGIRSVDALAAGNTASDPIVLGVGLSCFGAVWWLIRSAGRKTLFQLRRISADTGLTAMAYKSFGLINAGSVDGAVTGGRVRAVSSPAAFGGNPLTRIEIADSKDIQGLADWVRRDIASHRLNSLFAGIVPGNIYRVEVSGVIAQPHVADFIIRLAKWTNEDS